MEYSSGEVSLLIVNSTLRDVLNMQFHPTKNMACINMNNNENTNKNIKPLI